MVTAFVLVHADGKQFERMARDMLAIPGVSEVHVVAGEYDLVAVVRVEDTTELSVLLTDRLVQVEGVARTKTLVSLRGFANFDLSKVGGIGPAKEDLERV